MCVEASVLVTCTETEEQDICSAELRPAEMGRKMNIILTNRAFWRLHCESAQMALSSTP